MEYKPYFVFKINTSGLSREDSISELSIIFEDLSGLDSMNNPSYSSAIKQSDEHYKKSLEFSPYLKDMEKSDLSDVINKLGEFIKKHDPNSELPVVCMDLMPFLSRFINHSDEKLSESFGRRAFIDVKSLFFMSKGYIPTKTNLFKNYASFNTTGNEEDYRKDALAECFMINSVFWKILSKRMGM
jgi:hypothetical protein